MKKKLSQRIRWLRDSETGSEGRLSVVVSTTLNHRIQFMGRLIVAEV
jgi:hypothetical protein